LFFQRLDLGGERLNDGRLIVHFSPGIVLVLLKFEQLFLQDRDLFFDGIDRRGMAPERTRQT
jgi:hypothetical protein